MNRNEYLTEEIVALINIIQARARVVEAKVHNIGHFKTATAEDWSQLQTILQELTSQLDTQANYLNNVQVYVRQVVNRFFAKRDLHLIIEKEIEDLRPQIRGRGPVVPSIAECEEIKKSFMNLWEKNKKIDPDGDAELHKIQDYFIDELTKLGRDLDTMTARALRKQESTKIDN